MCYTIQLYGFYFVDLAREWRTEKRFLFVTKSLNIKNFSDNNPLLIWKKEKRFKLFLVTRTANTEVQTSIRR